MLARSGCTTVATTTTSSRRARATSSEAIVESAGRVGVRLHATRGSMDLGASQGGLPPDFAVETTDAALAASQEAVERYHDPSFGSLVHVAIAPCSPFSVTDDLLREAAVLARALGVRLHTHASETVEEDAYCARALRQDPPRSTSKTSAGSATTCGWRTACTSTTPRSPATPRRARASRTARPRTRGWPSGIAPVRDLLRAGVPVGLGVDGAASNESGQLGIEIREAVLMNRLRTGADSFSVRDGPAGRDDGRRAGARARPRDRISRGGQARRHRGMAGRRRRACRHPGPRRRARSRRSPRPCTDCSSAVGRSSSRDRSPPPTNR